MNDDWNKELEKLLEENKKWLEQVKCVKFGYDINEQNHQLCLEIIKWHELSKEAFTLLETIYENVFNEDEQINKDYFILKYNNKFKRVKNNYYNNMKVKDNLDCAE